MTTAIIGTGGIGSAIARQLASGGETLRLASADHESARTLAAEIGRAAVVAVDDSDALQGAGAVVLALRFFRGLWQPVTGAGGPFLRGRRRPYRPGGRAVDPDGRLRAGEGRRGRTVGPA